MIRDGTSDRVHSFSLSRLLPTFAGALRQKRCTRASLNKTPTNYISLESLINLLHEKNKILAKFSFRKCQKPVRRETTEIYRLSDSKVRAKWLHILIHKASINKSVWGFFDILIGCLDIHI